LLGGRQLRGGKDSDETENREAKHPHLL
jgi:hypothetical protein